jgi:hypothetical protein
MRVAPGQGSKISPRDFYSAPQSPDNDYRLVCPADGSRSQLYPYVDLSDHSLFIQAENDLTRYERASLYERWYSLCSDAFMHLEKRDGSSWRPISVSIMLPLSVAGYRAITTKDKAHRLSIVDLGREGIRSKLDMKKPFLLIDTWIVDREGGFGGVGHGKTQSRGGNANLLVLRHLTRFWNSANRFRHLNLLVETANPHLVNALEMMSFRPSGTSDIAEAFYQTSTVQWDAAAPAEFAALKDALRAIEEVPVMVGTTPGPTDWYYKEQLSLCVSADCLRPDPPVPMPLEYSIEWLTCAIAGRLDAVMVGWPGAAQDRLPADVPGTRRGCPGVPRRPGGGC